MKIQSIRLPHIGMRKVKSVLAVFLGFWLWQLVRLVVPELEVHPIFIYVYGLIEIRDTSKKTVDFGKLRIRSTAVGLCIGLPVIALQDILENFAWLQKHVIALDLALLLLGVLITLTIAEFLGCKAFCGLAAAVFIILVVYHSSGERYIYAVLRASQTALGVFVAWLLNVKLFPYAGSDPPADTK